MNIVLGGLLHPVVRGISTLFFKGNRKKNNVVKFTRTPEFTVTVLLKLSSEADKTASDLPKQKPLNVRLPKL